MFFGRTMKVSHGYCQAGETGDEESNGVGDDHPTRSFNQALNRASINEPTGPEHVVGGSCLKSCFGLFQLMPSLIHFVIPRHRSESCVELADDSREA
jgi:hypothetical protein